MASVKAPSGPPRSLLQEPYLQTFCQCCSYRLDPVRPVRILNLQCPGGETEPVVLPVIHGCECSSCQSEPWAAGPPSRGRGGEGNWGGGLETLEEQATELAPTEPWSGHLFLVRASQRPSRAGSPQGAVFSQLAPILWGFTDLNHSDGGKAGPPIPPPTPAPWQPIRGHPLESFSFQRILLEEQPCAPFSDL